MSRKRTRVETFATAPPLPPPQTPPQTPIRMIQVADGRLEPEIVPLAGLPAPERLEERVERLERALVALVNLLDRRIGKIDRKEIYER